jgi:hypothetical protein
MDGSGGAFVIDHGPDVRYRIGHQDNSRWDGFVFHPGDIADQHKVSQWNDLDADDLRAADLPDPGPPHPAR